MVFDKKSLVIIVLCFLFFNTFAILKSLPRNAHLAETESAHILGDCDRTIILTYRDALKKSERPFFSVKTHFLYFERNPGLFVFVAEMLIRSGIRDIFPLRLFFLALFNIGVVFMLKWIETLFKDRTVTLSCLILLSTSPLFLHFSSVIHQWPLDMLFFNMSIYYFLRYLDTKKTIHFTLTLIFYFLLCQSYYMYYVSAFILMASLMYYNNGHIDKKRLLILGLIPVISIVLLAIQLFILHGGIYILVDYLAARTLDLRVENSVWETKGSHLSIRNLVYYPFTLAQRIREYFHFDGFIMVFMLMFSMLFSNKKRERFFMLMLFIAGLSWNLFMIQHSKIHHFSVTFGFFSWSLIFAVFASKINLIINTRICNQDKRLLTKTALCALCAMYIIWNINVSAFFTLGNYIR